MNYMPKGAKCPKYVSGNSLKGSNILKKKKRKIHAAGKKGCGRGPIFLLGLNCLG
jgi:hypothetical protein